MKQGIKNLTKGTMLFCLTIVTAWFLLLLSAWIPNQVLSDNMTDSVYCFSDRDPFQESKSRRLCEITDNYADAISLNLAWNMGKGNPLESTINTCYYDGEEYGLNGGLYYTVVENVQPNTDYTRYWHGNLMFIRVLSVFTDIEGMKLIYFVVVLILIGLTIGVLGRKKHWDIAGILLISLVAIQVWNIRLSMEYMPMFFITFAMIPVYLSLEKKNDTYLVYLSVVTGVLTAFFDFLTTETMTILLPLAVVWAVRIKEGRYKSFKDEIIISGKGMLAWAVAYGGTFLLKWLLAYLVAGADSFTNAIGAAAQRIGSDLPEGQQAMNFIGDALLANINVLFGGMERIDYQRVLVGSIIVGLLLLSVWYLFRKNKKSQSLSWCLLILGIPVLARYIVLGNHSYLHCFFTYRAMIVVIFVLLMYIWFHIELPLKKKSTKK